MDDLGKILSETNPEDGSKKLAVHMLAPQMYAAAARLRRRRRGRLQGACFALAAVPMAALIWLCAVYGVLIYIPVGGAALTLALAPVLAYFVEEGRGDET